MCGAVGKAIVRPTRKLVELKQKASNALGNPAGIDKLIKIQREGVKSDSTLLGDNSKYDRNPSARSRNRTVLGGG